MGQSSTIERHISDSRSHAPAARTTEKRRNGGTEARTTRIRQTALRAVERRARSRKQAAVDHEPFVFAISPVVRDAGRRPPQAGVWRVLVLRASPFCSLLLSPVRSWRRLSLIEPPHEDSAGDTRNGDAATAQSGERGLGKICNEGAVGLLGAAGEGSRSRTTGRYHSGANGTNPA